MAIRLTIGTKLALGIAAILAPFLLGAPFLHADALVIVQTVTRLSLVDRPATGAVHDMEIALADTVLALKAYVFEPAPQTLERLRGEESDFRGAYRAYRNLVQAGRERRLGQRVEQAYEGYLANAQTLVRLRDEQSELLDRFLAGERSMNELLQARIGSPSPGTLAQVKALFALQGAARQIALDLGSFLRSRDPEHEASTQKLVQDFGEHLVRYRSLARTREAQDTATALEASFAGVSALAAALMARGREMDLAWARTIEARQAVDNVLDKDLKRHIEADVLRAEEQLLAMGRRAASGLLVVLAVAMALATGVVALTARSIRRPLQQLLATIESLRGGDLSRRARVTSSDETAQIVDAFNRMADDLLATTVSRQYVEGIIRSMSESLVVVDGDGTVTTANPAACVLLGYREPELVGSPYAAILEQWPAVAADAANAPVHDLETRYRTRDGRIVPVLLYADRLVLADGGGPAIVCVALDMTEIRRSRQQLAHSRERLRGLARHLNATVEAERTAIAREIHDQLGQAMTSLKLDVQWLRRELAPEDPAAASRVRTRIGAMSELIDESIRIVRRVATELRPAALDDLGLGPALQALAEQFGQRTGIACEVEVDAEIALSANQSTALYRIAQEALTNVARHAHATRVALRLGQEADSVVLEIRDNGRGITPTEVAAPYSLGLLGMEERAQEQGATVRIHGEPGRGTEVTVVLGLDVEPAPSAAAETTTA